ncbi:MAG: hypothetical protein ACUVXA_03140 [Candidatus Jordarchaeum sp.]|uniref:hypothetical protein n=1 Tax=Candidatus Jordarchaeum sp. TaxID=2823881 RepID=UPI004049AB16
MSETERPKLANLISIIFFLSALAILILGYTFFLKPLSTGPSIESILNQFPLSLTPDLFSVFLYLLYIPRLLAIQISASNYMLLFATTLIMAIILIVSAFGFSYRKKWGYYLTILSSLFLIITPALGYFLGFPLIYIVGSVVAAILGVLFLFYLRGDVKEEF